MVALRIPRKDKQLDKIIHLYLFMIFSILWTPSLTQNRMSVFVLVHS